MMPGDFSCTGPDDNGNILVVNKGRSAAMVDGKTGEITWWQNLNQAEKGCCQEVIKDYIRSKNLAGAGTISPTGATKGLKPARDGLNRLDGVPDFSPGKTNREGNMPKKGLYQCTCRVCKMKFQSAGARGQFCSDKCREAEKAEKPKLKKVLAGRAPIAIKPPSNANGKDPIHEAIRFLRERIGVLHGALEQLEKAREAL